MVEHLRETAIDPLGEMPWGAHISLFYETRDDLLDTVVPYFAAGLAHNERCVWAVSDPVTETDAAAALNRAVPELNRRLADGDIEIVPGRELYTPGERFDLKRFTDNFITKTETALARGFDGLRISGNSFWSQTGLWRSFCQYEHELDHVLSKWPMLALCTYRLDRSLAFEVLDVVRVHEFTVARRRGRWEVVETPELKETKRELVALKAELEERVRQRTGELAGAYEQLMAENRERERAEAALSATRAELARAARFTSMGVLAASIAHEVNQPLSGVVTNSEAALRWLSRTPPGLEEAGAALARTVRDAHRASDVIERIRALLAGRAERVEVDVDDAIREVVAMTRNFLQASKVEVQLDLAADLPRVVGDRLQLEQAIINLLINAAEAMNDQAGERRIIIRSRAGEGGGVVVSVEDRGRGLDAETAARIFEPFFTTKPNGMGMGLSIAKSIVEAHGGQLSAAPAPTGGAVLQLHIPRNDA